MRHSNPLDAFAPGLTLFQRHVNLCLTAGIICVVVNGAVQVPAIVLELAQGGNSPRLDQTVELIENGTADDQLWLLLNWMTMFIHGCASGVLSLGLTQIGLKLLDGEEATIEDIIPAFTQLPGAFAAATIVTVLSTLGLLMCCVPGFFVFGLLMYWPAIMQDQKVGGLVALTRSVSLALTMPKEHCLAGALLMAMLGAGYQCCGLPVIFIGPMTALIVATSYRNAVPKPTPVVPV